MSINVNESHGRHMDADMDAERPKITSARAVLAECFWGDYQISAEELLNRLEKNDPGFERFLFSKIMENSAHPSRHIRALLEPDKWRTLIERYMKTARNSKKLRLVAANLTGDYDLAKEYGWRV